MRSSRLPLFDELDRTDSRPATHLETSFQFLNRGAAGYWAQVRDLMQAWLDQVADKDYADLRGRLRADDAASHSASLELYLHELFRRASYRVTIHPSVPTGSKRPDFLVEGHGHAFYLEATMPGPHKDAHGRSQRRAALLDSIQRCHSPDFFLSLDHLVVGPRPAPARRIRREIEQWLTGLDPDTVTYDLDRREEYRWAADGWEVTFSAIPVSSEHRGKSDHRPIGVYADGEVEVIDDAPTIRAALDRKATAYGDLDHPLVIAVGTYIWDHDRWHSTNALYGRAAITWWKDADGKSQTASIRQPDGFYGIPGRWENRGVAAVLHVNQFQPQHLQRADLTLWPHPGALHDVGSLANKIPIDLVELTGGVLAVAPSSLDPAAFFGLTEPWPQGKAFPDD